MDKYYEYIRNASESYVKHKGYEIAIMNPPYFNNVLKYAILQGENISTFALDSFIAHCFVRVFHSPGNPLSEEELVGIQQVFCTLPGRFWRLLTADELLDVLKVLSLVGLHNKLPSPFFYWWGVHMRSALDSLSHAQLSELMGLVMGMGVSKALGARFHIEWNAQWRRTLAENVPTGTHVEKIRRFDMESYAHMLEFGVQHAVNFDARDVEWFFSRFRNRIFAVSPEELKDFATICDTIQAKLRFLDAPALAVVPGAFVAFKVVPSDAFMREWCLASRKALSSFENAALFTVARAILEGAPLALRSGPGTDFFQHWAHEIMTARLRTLSTAQLCDVLRIVHHLRIDVGDAFYAAWAKECSHRLKLDQFSETDLALSIHWVGMLKVDASALGYEYFKLWTERAAARLGLFNTTSLVNIVCAAGRSQFLLKTDAPLLVDWMKALVPRVDELQFVDLANCLFAMGQLRLRDGFFIFAEEGPVDSSAALETATETESELFHRFLWKMEERCERLMSSLPTVPPSGLVLVLSGLEMLNAFHLIGPNLIVTWLAKFQQYLPQLNALELSQSILSLGRIRLPPDMYSPSLFPSLEASLVRFLPQMEPEQLDDIFEGFELLNWPVDFEVSAQCAIHVSEKMLSVDPKTLSGALRLVRRLKLDSGTVPESFFLDFAQACKQNLLLFPPVDVPWIMTSLAHLKIDPHIMGSDFFTKWAAICDQLWPMYSPLHYASLVYDLGYMGLPLEWLVPNFFQHWAEHARLICFLFSPLDVSNTLYGLRLLGLGQADVGPEFSAAFQRALLRVMADLDPLHLARSVAALPSVNFAWDSDLLQAATKACVAQAFACSPIQLSHMILGFAMLDCQTPLLQGARASVLDLCHVAASRFAESGWAGLEPAWVRNTWYALTWFQVESPIPSLQTLLPVLANNGAVPVGSDPTETSVGVGVGGGGGGGGDVNSQQDYIRHHYIEELQLYVDIYIPSSNTIVFLGSEGGYDSRSGKLEPFEVFLSELLKRQGYGVMSLAMLTK